MSKHMSIQTVITFNHSNKAIIVTELWHYTQRRKERRKIIKPAGSDWAAEIIKMMWEIKTTQLTFTNNRKPVK